MVLSAPVALLALLVLAAAGMAAVWIAAVVTAHLFQVVWWLAVRAVRAVRP
ncbi:hypothetical protein ACWGDX_02910 [Streptomyces sp. NPDC055025]